MSSDSDYLMTIDGRDLFDLIRGTVKSVIEDHGMVDRTTSCWIWQESNERTIAAMNMWNDWRTNLPGVTSGERSPVTVFDKHGRSIDVMVSPIVARQISVLRDERDVLMAELRKAREA